MGKVYDLTSPLATVPISQFSCRANYPKESSLLPVFSYPSSSSRNHSNQYPLKTPLKPFFSGSPGNYMLLNLMFTSQSLLFLTSQEHPRVDHSLLCESFLTCLLFLLVSLTSPSWTTLPIPHSVSDLNIGEQRFHSVDLFSIHTHSLGGLIHIFVEGFTFISF